MDHYRPNPFFQLTKHSAMEQTSTIAIYPEREFSSLLYKISIQKASSKDHLYKATSEGCRDGAECPHARKMRRQKLMKQ